MVAHTSTLLPWLMSAAGAWDVHGSLQLTSRASIGEDITVHGDPLVPGAAYGWFDHTGSVMEPWAELVMRIDRGSVEATVALASWSLAASPPPQPQAQLWIASAFLTYAPDVRPLHLKLKAGVFPEHYGFMGKSQSGAYGEALMGSVYGSGGATILTIPFEGDLTITAEAGLKGQLDKAPLGTPFDASTDFAHAEQGATFAAHGHVGLTFRDLYTLTLHAIRSWNQDDRKDPRDRLPDGSLTISGIDLRLDGGRFGSFYVGGAYVRGEHTAGLGRLVTVLNSGGGQELRERYFGFANGGSGALTLVGGQYTLSLGTLLRHPMDFWGEGPDLTLSIFGIHGNAGARQANKMRKVGGEASYSLSRHVVATVRVDHVSPDLAVPERAFSVLSPRLLLRRDWLAPEALSLQYSYYLVGMRTRVEGDRRLRSFSSQKPDHHMFMLYATTSW